MFLLENLIQVIDTIWMRGLPILLTLIVYLIPVFIAFYRKLEKRILLTFINILLGWTFIVWIACIVWAILGKTTGKGHNPGTGKVENAG